MQLLFNDIVTVKHYVDSLVNGEVIRTLVNIYNTRGALMPAALTEVSDSVTETIRLDDEGFRLTDYKKFYSKTMLSSADLVTEVLTGITFKVMKRYNYSRFGTMAKHYKYILAKVEN